MLQSGDKDTIQYIKNLGHPNEPIAYPKLYEASDVSEDLIEQKGPQERIENMLDHLDDKLDKFNQFNNPKRLSDLRKHCNTHTSKNVSEGISSRLLASGVSGSGTIIRSTTRHHQSLSDVDINSLITISDGDTTELKHICDSPS